MAERLQLSWACLAVLGAVGLTSRASFGAPNDAAALKLRDDAIYTDYLATNFESAASKLRRGLALCKAAEDCGPAVRGRLLCDLGVMDFLLQKPDEGRMQFAAALREDPTLTLDNDLSSVEMQREFAAAKAGGSALTPPGAGHTAPPLATGDMAHTPPRSQAFLTPIPIYVELPDGITAAKVYVRYKPFGVTEWKTAHMTAVGNGYGTEIPCGDVGDSRGEMKYFIQAVDSSGDLLASSGRLVEPYRVSIVERVDGEAPHLPGQAPPAACASATDCPPAFPGCRATSKSTACVSSDECSAGQKCADGVCTEPDSTELDERAPFIRNWLSVAFQTDALLMPSASNACAGGTGYTCFGSDGSYYPDTPLAGADDQVNGGITMATSRVLLGYDRAFTENVTFGARLGYALAGGPQRPTSSSFMPIHVEARAAYWFGHNPMARSGLRFFVLAAGGMAEVDASVPVDVYTSARAYQNQQSRAYLAWKKTGLGFAALGGGGMVAITPSTGIALEAKAMEMFPTPATGFGLQLAYLVGL